MRCANRIHHHPYFPLNRLPEAQNPFVCRLAPFEDGFEGEFLAEGDAHTLYVRPRGQGEYSAAALCGRAFCLRGLLPGAEYEFYIEDSLGRKSLARLVRTGAAPEGARVINYLHAEDEQYAFSGRYLCSPSLARMANGRLIASMDVYGGKMAQNLTILFSSCDDGRTWRYLNDLYPFYWGTLFTHRGVLYALGLTTEYGNLQIVCSRDCGVTWSRPETLLYGSNCLCENGGVHRAPMQVTEFGGKLYTTCEYGCWAKGSHLPGVLCADADADLMAAENWFCTPFLPFAGDWAREAIEQKDSIEGNLIAGPDGRLYNILRWSVGKMLVLRVNADNPDAPCEYVCLRDAPVSSSMFRILKYKGEYLLVTNRKTDFTPQCKSPRSTLSVFASRDLIAWRFLFDVVNREREDPYKLGFQYPSVLLEGDKMYLSVRSAYNGANSYHNSNTVLFWKRMLAGEDFAK